MRLYVKELIADPETRSITGTLVDPLTIPDKDEDPEPDGSGSSICRYMVDHFASPRTCLGNSLVFKMHSARSIKDDFFEISGKRSTTFFFLELNH